MRRARELRKAGPPPQEWYDILVFYFSNPAAVYGPEDTIPFPAGVEELDYELELAAVIGADGEIGGFTIMNHWSARDLQRAEMTVGLGPAKGKDFATSLGPVLVTVDELDGSDAEMVARVNAEERSRGNSRDMHHSWQAIVAHAERNTGLFPGTSSGRGRWARVQPRARRWAVVAARRRRRARDRGHRRPSQHDRPVAPS